MFFSQNLGGGGGGGGGGRAGGFNQSDSPPISPSKERSGANMTLAPATIKQLLSATQHPPDDTFRLNNAELNQVTIVGQIQKASSQMTNMNYLINDGTGSIDVRQWVDPDDKSEFMINLRSRLKELVYVRVIGHLRAFNEQRGVVAFRIMPLEDHNELVFHFLEALSVSLAHRRSSALAPTSLRADHFGSSSSGGGGGFSDSDPPPPLRQEIARVLRQHDKTPHGATIAHLLQALAPQGATEMSIRGVLDMLVSEGRAYTTTDDNHFKLSDV